MSFEKSAPRILVMGPTVLQELLKKDIWGALKYINLQVSVVIGI